VETGGVMDWWTKLEGGVLHLKPSHDQVAGDLLERRTLHRRHCQRSTHGSEGRRDNVTEASSE
jgi:hypothetical protein